MKAQDIVDHYKNQTKAAAEIGVSEQCVRNWLKLDKVPRLAQLAIQVLTKGKLKAD